MAPLNSRRDFIINSGKAGLGLYFGSAVLASCNATKNAAAGNELMQHIQTEYGKKG